MTPFLIGWLAGIWEMLLESSFLFLVGLILAGLLWYFLSEKDVARLLSRGRGGGVIRAAIVGIPLPLCSCSVLPVATQLRKAGAGRGAVTSFLIATPESGVDSIALTWALTDPLMTVARPVTAFATAIAAGGIEGVTKQEAASAPEIDEPANCGCDDSCGSENKTEERTLLGSLRYAFTDIMGDLAPYLLIGFILAGLAGSLLGEGVSNLPATLTSGWGGYVGAIIAGLPMYICASASTPLAAVLLTSGFSPGMVLVFMLVGPATNIATLSVVKKLLGNLATVRYLLVIVIVSVLAGLLVDQAYQWLDVTPAYKYEAHTHGHSWYETGSAVLLTFLVLYWTLYKLVRRLQNFSLN